MPIYSYRCESCGFGKDVLQKLSDAPLTRCPECGAETFRKQVTAAGFQLKGSGWYVTDFRGGNSNAPNASNASGKNGNGDSSSAGASTEGGTSAPADNASSGSAEAKSSTPSTPAPAPASSGGASNS
ncbi:FmdB family zinc ribbon protein [Paraburkholderia rhizosphaerae]|uniref:Putative FmdB family regulatory protein n=1 Tax=Paraburkholderia rhizosphaerae TaxID=480658 RepID=A0A4R8M1Q3_9BURK|nr:FmdB family zinc ribbon protein [Paraburkholderia rhizosphaerae]TDY53379.1 putative FmdB family regulatory protein [Paraburkholderia rhizosphaerae]